MDPLTCLSVASNVVQFVDFTLKIYSETRQLYKDGQLEVHAQTAKATKDLSNFSKEMARPIRAEGENRGLTENEMELEAICKDCSKLADDMVTRLKKFDITGKGGVLKSVGQVLKSMWSTKELAATEKKLARYRDMMDSRLLGSLRERVDQVLREQYAQTAVINNHTRQVVASALLDIHASLHLDLQAHTKVVSALLDREVRNFRDVDKLHKGIVHNVHERSSGYPLTEEEGQVYFNIQQREAGLHKAIVEEVVESLRYDTINERYEAVAEAHRKTLEWIFEPVDEEDDPGQVHWSSFVKWLREGDGIYWINGKAGSGKSTLMKYIYENPRTQEHLQVWAGNTPFHTSMFFFWWRGTKLQKSQGGLLRSLLYDVLHKIPELVPYVLPSQWATLYAAKTNTTKLPPVNIWTTSSLSKAFQTLITQQEIPMKLCLFIDGLDEYDGLEVEIAKVFKGVVLSSHVKVCVSSRPHVPFEDAFTGRPKLRLQDLTNSDIHHYIQDRLVHDEMMEALKAKEPVECQNLMVEIADAARGVFLWVTLVVASLLNGLSNHDHVSDLQMRLRTLPKDLDLLYEEMVLKVDGIYSEEASRLYQLIAEATEQPDDWKPAELLSIHSLYLAMKQDLDIAHEITQAPPDDQAILEQTRRMDILLKTRCGGLLEVQYGGSKTADLSPSLKVSYLHRTVRDFLETLETRQVLLKRTGGSDKDAFKPAVAIFKSIVVQIKRLELHPSASHGLKDLGLTYARRIEVDKRISPEELLKLFDIFSYVAKLYSMIPSAIECSLCRYLERKLVDENTPEQDILHIPALDYALVGPIDQQEFITPEMVSLLIEFGADPNKRFNGSTPWQKALSHLLRNYDRLRDRGGALMYWSRIITALLENGADPTATCQGPNRFAYLGDSWSASDVIAEIFGTLPLTMISLKRLLQRAIQSDKGGKRKLPSSKAQILELHLSRVALILNCDLQKPHPSTKIRLTATEIRPAPTEIHSTPTKEAAASFKCGLCCCQQ